MRPASVLRLALRCNNTVLLNLDLVLLAHRSDKLQSGGRCLGSEALDNVCSHTSVNCAMQCCALQHTVFVSDDALGLANALLGLLYDVVWGLVRKADDDGSLGSDSHGGSGEQRSQDGEGSEAHCADFGRVCESRASGVLIRVVRCVRCLRSCRFLGKVGAWGHYGVPGRSKPRECVIAPSPLNAVGEPPITALSNHHRAKGKLGLQPISSACTPARKRMITITTEVQRLIVPCSQSEALYSYNNCRRSIANVPKHLDLRNNETRPFPLTCLLSRIKRLRKDC
jgi:hypothetical protein